MGVARATEKVKDGLYENVTSKMNKQQVTVNDKRTQDYGNNWRP